VSGVLGPGPDAPRPVVRIPEVDAVRGLRVGHRVSRFVGIVVAADAESVLVRDGNGQERRFRLAEAAFVVEREGRLVPVTLRRPVVHPGEPAGPRRTASGSIAAAPVRVARTAGSSRIWVEGVHDAELVERVWGDDLRELGVVVEPLHGIDDLVARVDAFRPADGRRLGVLVDHLVAGSKEWRIARNVTDRWSPFVVVAGHPYVDVWQAVRPDRLGWTAWPVVARGRSWKAAITHQLREPDERSAWLRIRAAVGSWVDLEAEFVGPVESLIDHVTEEIITESD
jgi:hypothetical protein